MKRRERGRIRTAAIKQSQQLAAVHEPSGASFNIGPVVRKNDGSVVSSESVRRQLEQAAARAAARRSSAPRIGDIYFKQNAPLTENSLNLKAPGSHLDLEHSVHPGHR